LDFVLLCVRSSEKKQMKNVKKVKYKDLKAAVEAGG
jgi:hypothetical protein